MVASTVKSRNTPGELPVFASSFSSGEAGVVLVNKGLSARIASIDFRHFRGGNKFYWYTLTGGNDNGEFSTKVFVNGQGGTAAVGGPADYTGIKANAAALTGTIKIQVPARAVVYLVAGS